MIMIMMMKNTYSLIVMMIADYFLGLFPSTKMNNNTGNRKQKTKQANNHKQHNCMVLGFNPSPEETEVGRSL